MDWKKLADKVEQNLNKVGADVQVHNVRVQEAIRDLDIAIGTVEESPATNSIEFGQRTLLASQLKHMRMQWQKEYIEGWG
jgi:hypothetical protein